jgi:hypothetical protein
MGSLRGPQRGEFNWHYPKVRSGLAGDLLARRISNARQPRLEPPHAPMHTAAHARTHTNARARARARTHTHALAHTIGGTMLSQSSRIDQGHGVDVERGSQQPSCLPAARAMQAPCYQGQLGQMGQRGEQRPEVGRRSSSAASPVVAANRRPSMCRRASCRVGERRWWREKAEKRQREKEANTTRGAEATAVGRGGGACGPLRQPSSSSGSHTSPCCPAASGPLSPRPTPPRPGHGESTCMREVLVCARARERV